MQSETVNIKVSISNITSDSIDNIASKIEKSSDQIITFLLTRGFSNLLHQTDFSGNKVLATLS